MIRLYKGALLRPISSPISSLDNDRSRFNAKLAGISLTLHLLVFALVELNYPDIDNIGGYMTTLSCALASFRPVLRRDRPFHH